MSDSVKLLLAGVGAAGAAAALYCLLNQNDKPQAKQTSGSGAAKGKGEMSKEKVQELLKEIIDNQELMKGYMKDLAKELRAKKLSFDDTYERVKKAAPADPLEKHGLSMQEFDDLLDKYQNDATIREAIAKIMGTPSAATVTSEKVQTITVKTVIEVHQFMLKELEELVENLQNMPKSKDLDTKTITIVAQAMVGAKMEEKFGITSEDIESAVLMYHAMLSADRDFSSINEKIQHTMGKLMGAPFAAGA